MLSPPTSPDPSPSAQVERSDEDLCLLSVAAVTGTEAPKAFRLHGKVGNQVLLMLVDSGSSHSFVNSAFVSRAGCDITPVNPVRVRVANGQFMSCTSAVKNLSWWYNVTTFSEEMRILDLGGYDAVLGMDWLGAHSRMQCHRLESMLAIKTDDKQVQLQGV